jgi:hypothetical protein
VLSDRSIPVTWISEGLIYNLLQPISRHLGFCRAVVLRREYGNDTTLYGHSWEIQELELCNELEEIPRYVSNREDLIYATNSEVRKLRESAFSQELAGSPI